MDNKDKLLWAADLDNGRYQNPILFADYSDPDVIREGGVCYMTASSFNYVPGLPILVSLDMVNWKLVNYALDNIPGEQYNRPLHAKGVWAPAIRYQNGYFYIFYGMPDEGIYMVRTKDALGKWEEPVLVLPGKGLIDPCPFWDEDGRAYVIHGYAMSRIGFKSFLGIFEMTPDGTQIIGEDHLLFDGRENQMTIEGPKVYKKDGFYYILAPAGGVKTGWQTALRSKSIYGPYEEMVVMKQGNARTNGPHQGGLITDDAGNDWFIHFQDKGLYGRIVHLQPVIWKDGWPCMGEHIEGYCGEPVDEWEKPVVDLETSLRSMESSLANGKSLYEDLTQKQYLAASDEFQGGTLGLQWQWTGNAKKEFFSLSDREGALRLFGQPENAEGPIWEQSNILTQKIVCPSFSASVKLDASSLHKEGSRAGLLMMGGDYAYLALRPKDKGYDLVYGVSSDPQAPDYTKVESAGFVSVKQETEEILTSLEEPVITLHLSLVEKAAKQYAFSMAYETVNGELCKVDQASAFFPSDHTWVGAKLGVFSLGEGYADFMNFQVALI